MVTMETERAEETRQLLDGKRLCFVGCGVMAEAIISSLLRNELVTTDQITGGEPIDARRNELHRNYGVEILTDNRRAVDQADIVLLTIKPQSVDSVLSELAGRLIDGQVVVSIVPGVSIERLSKGLQHNAIVRSMPNTPSQIGHGVTAWMAAPTVTGVSRSTVSAILGAMGTAVQLDSEDAIDMATAISGSGPAYAFLMLEALTDAGVHLGFSRPIAQQLVEETLFGAILYARESNKHPVELRNMVTTPGGTTASALYELERSGFRTVVADAVWAAYRRANELGES